MPFLLVYWIGIFINRDGNGTTYRPNQGDPKLKWTKYDLAYGFLHTSKEQIQRSIPDILSQFSQAVKVL
ncbi:hypothetical protein P8452_50056 [Trifolium repens]|nr:hypothetical protein P8452_50056 [Trifolium repens]